MEFIRPVLLESVVDRLPAFPHRAYGFGDAGEGRVIFRLLKVHENPKPQEK